ncbi:MAG: toxin-activating lysine-acyltransferase [Pseudomonadota bacterium]
MAETQNSTTKTSNQQNSNQTLAQSKSGSGCSELPRDEPVDGQDAAALKSGSLASNSKETASAFEAIRNLNAGLGETVGMLLRDPKFRHLSLADLEWLVLPPLAANQVLTMRGKIKDKAGIENGLTVPLAIAFWAKVSEEIDRKLEVQKEAAAPLRLAPSDWVSGDIPWLVLMSGPDEILPKLEEKLKGAMKSKMKVFR